MTRPISKADRDEAIVMLLASNDASIVAGTFRSVSGSGFIEPGEMSVAATLALDAWRVVDRWVTLDCTYLEAAALLRDGWIPGEPVFLLKKGPR